METRPVQASAGAELGADGRGVLAEHRDPTHDRLDSDDLGRRQQRAEQRPVGRVLGIQDDRLLPRFSQTKYDDCPSTVLS